MLEAADLVIAFDRINLDSIAARYPHLKDRIHLLGEADTDTGTGDAGARQILDPEGKDDTTFLSTYQRIDACLAALARQAPPHHELLQKSTQC